MTRPREMPCPQYPDLKTTCTLSGGVEREQGGHVFASAKDAIKAARSLGQELTLDESVMDREVTLKTHKDGRLVVEIERDKNGKALEGWDNKKSKYVKIFNVKTDPGQDDELDFTEYDNLVRALESAAIEHAGWVSQKGKEWVRHPPANIKMLLQSLDHPRAEAEAIMGAALTRGWRLVNLPFRDE